VQRKRRRQSTEFSDSDAAPTAVPKAGGAAMIAAPAAAATHRNHVALQEVGLADTTRVLPGVQNEYESVTFGEDKQPQLVCMLTRWCSR